MRTASFMRALSGAVIPMDGGSPRGSGGLPGFFFEQPPRQEAMERARMIGACFGFMEFSDWERLIF
jgi:hypothetical protein